MSRTIVCALALVFTLAWFAGLDERKLARADEARYAEIAREMAVTGDWLTPRLNGLKYFEKPPLQYWATAAAFGAFGVDEWTARLWPALTGFAGLLLVFFAGNRAFGPPAGHYAALVLAGASLYAFMAHVTTLDMGVSFFLALAAIAMLLAQLDATPESLRRRWMLAAWAAAALAVLSKGLIGLVLPAGALGLYVLWRRDWPLLRRLHFGAGIALFLAIAAPWLIAVSLANAEFAQFFFIHEHFERFLTKAHDRYEPAWYFVPVLALGIMPWLVGFVPALREAWRGAAPARFQPQHFLLAWCATVFVFFSASSSKLPPYILPLFPAAALLVGAYLVRASRGVLVAQALLAALAGLGLLAIAARLPELRLTRLAAELLAAYRPWLAAAAASLVLLALAAAVFAWRGRRLASIAALAAAGLACTQIATIGREAFSPAYSAYHLVERARPALKADVPFYAVAAYDHSVPFYLGRTVTLVAFQNELAPGTLWEKDKYIADIATFAEIWRHEGDAYALFSAAEFDALRKRYRLATRLIASDDKMVIVRKP